MNSKQTAVDAPVKVLLGAKLGMTRLRGGAGRVVPIAVVRIGTNVMTQTRTPETDGYPVVQLVSGELKIKNVTKPPQGHFDKARVVPRHKLVGIRTSDTVEHELGQEPTTGLFETGQKADVIGTSRGKGFAGIMERHGFSGVSASHGTHRSHREPGSIGACTTPSRVFRGLRMAGRTNKDRVTVLNLPVRAVDVEKGIALLAGAVPGNRGGAVTVRTTMKGA